MIRDTYKVNVERGSIRKRSFLSLKSKAMLEENNEHWSFKQATFSAIAHRDAIVISFDARSSFFSFHYLLLGD